MTYPALAYPLEVVAGRFRTVDGDSAAHVEVQAEIVLRTRPGDVEATPKMGLRDLIGTMGPIGPTILDALEESIPGAAFIAREDLEAVATRTRNALVARGEVEG